MKFNFTFILSILQLKFLLLIAQEIDEDCILKMNGKNGICKNLANCESDIENLKDKNFRPEICKYDGIHPIVCCVENERSAEIKERVGLTISEQKCIEYSEAVYIKTSINPLLYSSRTRNVKIDKCSQANPLISDGTDARPREFPHMALLGKMMLKSVEWFCGGTLISNKFVLTAAHCIRRVEFVRLGDLAIDRDEDDAMPKQILVSEKILHPDYKINSKYNDIALLKLESEVILNPYIRPACLPTSNNEEIKHFIATGWGKIGHLLKASQILLKVPLELFDYNECNQTYSSYIGRHFQNGIKERIQMCVGSRFENKDTCPGDSGGPLQIYHKSQYCMFTVLGITSFGMICGVKNSPGVYTKVFPYVKWIEGVVWNENQ